MLVTDVILHYKNGAKPALLTSYNRAQVRIKNISALYVHFDVQRNLFLLLFLSVLIFDGIDIFLIRIFRENIFHITHNIV